MGTSAHKSWYHYVQEKVYSASHEYTEVSQVMLFKNSDSCALCELELRCILPFDQDNTEQCTVDPSAVQPLLAAQVQSHTLYAGNTRTNPLYYLLCLK